MSEGKNDPIYNAHSYHTKVPHKAIMRYILHYTEPGDIVFDGFCGTGMTGVAAQLCGDKTAVESLGYRVDKDGTILSGDDENGKVWSRSRSSGAPGGLERPLARRHLHRLQLQHARRCGCLRARGQAHPRGSGEGMRLDV